MSENPGKFCKSCRYVLDGISSFHCPECGRWFNPESAWTYDNYEDSQPRPGWGHLWASLVCLVLVFLPMVLLSFVQLQPGWQTSLSQFCVCMSLVGVIGLFVNFVSTVVRRLSSCGRWGAPFYVGMGLSSVAALLFVLFVLLAISGLRGLGP